MQYSLIVIIPLICTIITSLIAILSYKDNIKHKGNEEIVENVKRDTTISTKLDMVLTGNAELKSEIKGINEKFDDISDRVARCEEKTNNICERLDKVDGKINYDFKVL